MIIAVTVNPAIDVTSRGEAFEPGRLNRLGETVVNAGGKGINAARMAKALGGSVLAVGFSGGAEGDFFLSLLRNENLPHRFLRAGLTRINTKLIDRNGELTELNAPGGEVGDGAWRDLEALLTGLAAPGTVFVLSGSLPPGSDPGWYGSMIAALQERGAATVLDASGEALRLGVLAQPGVIKPNKSEREGLDISAYRGLTANSLGAEGARFVQNGRSWFVPGLPVEVASPAGAGDCMTGALAYALEANLPPEEAFLLAAACATASVMTPGTACPALPAVFDLRKRLTIVRE
ncbi:MAG: 1-phosphofructokinase family hexose kinase [Oscillospiraceae bacterium]|jgi:1-phosphofructokinase|nr:1-phosphofructokinase family hexose kinase [Oscillospiraceae bacterium]